MSVIASQAYHYARLWLTLGLFMLLVIIVLSLIAIDQSMISFSYLDKVEHFIAWGMMMFWFVSLYPRRGLVLLAILLTLSLGVELAQALTTWRQGSAGDLIANFLGLLAGWAIARATGGRLLRYLDKWLYHRANQA